MSEDRCVEVLVPEQFYKNSKLDKQKLEKLAQKFRDYVANPAQTFLNIKLPHKDFGKEEALLYPADKEGKTVLYKVHVKPESTQQKRKKPWKGKLLKEANRTSDSILVYTKGAINSNHYILLAIFHPEGHKKLNDRQLMQSVFELAELLRVDV